MDEETLKHRVAVDATMGGNGAINSKFLVNRTGLESGSFRAHQEKLEKLLREGLDVQWGHALDEVKEIDGDMALCFQNG
ncbi:hypothetical protein M501DRAFT_995699 [Patellaria atrata CBS 101060]|uniref:Uncharacterized protein n=1 Tax=Patellaria atrata CBS 101060 TaxID=1346257 RepID=A0A9P4S8F3_9PEZI|nr:hypothetical protein M501DRAFT_995699 [Patellaria atrata CBS 101060]